jgi:hypothetical protein
VVVFTGSGSLLGQFGMQGTGNGQFNSAGGVAVDPAGDIYVVDLNNNRIEKFSAPPHIAMISDVGNDQGGQVGLRVLPCSADSRGSGVTITGYEVYRRNDPLPSPAESSRQGDASALAAVPSSIELAGWTYLTTFPAHGESEYNVVVPTLANAHEGALNYSTFLVRAATTDPFTFYDSTPEYGYSIDNLSPSAPTGFAAAVAGGATQLHWNPSPASDFATFRLYRGASAGFVPGPASLVATVTDTACSDPGPIGGYYKLSAVDFNGNESVFATLGPGQTLDAPGASPTAFALDGARPNPARAGRLNIAFALSSEGPARLELIDLAGRRVRTRDVGALGPGHHVVDLVAGRPLSSGIYIVRLTQGALSRTARVVVIE